MLRRAGPVPPTSGTATAKPRRRTGSAGTSESRRGVLRVRLHRVAVAGAASVAAIAAVLLPASAANAAANGTGWSASWDYYTDTSFTYGATLPGVSLVGFGVDGNGTRSSVAAALQDTARDGYCARAYMIGGGNESIQTVCDGQASRSISLPNFTGGLAVVIARILPDGTFKQSNLVVIPDSSGDPTLRTTGTGVSWQYTSMSNFSFEVRRPGVDLVGFGGATTSANPDRFALATVNRTAPSACSAATVYDAYGHGSAGVACSSSTFGQVPIASFEGAITAHACALSQCLDASITDPTDLSP